MSESLYKAGLTLRGDHYYCPLALQLSTYWNCETNCVHCYLRRLNRTWGTDLRPLDIDALKKQILRADKSQNTSLAFAIHQRKTIYVGAKTDAYQPAELKYGATREALSFLLAQGFSVVIVTKFTENLMKDLPLLNTYRDQVTIMPIITPGWERDWELLERKKTTEPGKRLAHAVFFKHMGFAVGINGEPFIPGFHTVADFENTLQKLYVVGIRSYNTYNLHFNDYNAKQMHEAGIDIEKVWTMNQNLEWKGILKQLIDISKKYGIELGCPDFVNSGEFQESVNTCCGVSVPNPCTFNMIHWKKLKQKGMSNEAIINTTWDGVGDKEEGLKLISGAASNMYTLNDIDKSEDKLL